MAFNAPPCTPQSNVCCIVDIAIEVLFSLHWKAFFCPFLSRRNHEAHREQHHHQSHHQAVHHNSHTAMNHTSRPKEYVKSTASDDESEVSTASRFFFGLLWCFAQIGLWGAVLMLLYWFLKFDQGFAWKDERRKMFNLHAFLMLTGFIFFNGQGMMNRCYWSSC